jgi:Virulence-associated protein E
LQNLDPWQSTGCWYDIVRERHMLGKTPVQEGDDTAAGAIIERATQIRVTNLALVGRALDYVCRQTTRDLLREWVATLPTVPVSDLLPTWLRTYAHVPDTVSDAYVADLSRIIPVSIIARIERPGCQFRYVPIFEGPEDTGKSKLTKALAGHDPYGRSWHVALSAGMEGKEAYMMLEGALIAELEELWTKENVDAFPKQRLCSLSIHIVPS